jgi:hypothetical protein
MFFNRCWVLSISLQLQSLEAAPSDWKLGPFGRLLMQAFHPIAEFGRWFSCGFAVLDVFEIVSDPKNVKLIICPLRDS